MFSKANWRNRKLLIGGLTAIVAGAMLTFALLDLWIVGSTTDDEMRQSEVSELDKPSPTPVLPPAQEPSPQPAEPPSDSRPVRMVIEKIGVDAPVITLSLDSERIPEVPTTGDTLAWYDFGSNPGHGSNAVFSGHVTWNQSPAVFWDLDDLEQGDVIDVYLEDGTDYRYRVTDTLAVEWDDPDGVKLIQPTPNEAMTLVTCGGTWVPDASQRFGGNYTHRTVVRAQPVADEARASLPTADNGE